MGGMAASEGTTASEGGVALEGSSARDGVAIAGGAVARGGRVDVSRPAVVAVAAKFSSRPTSSEGRSSVSREPVGTTGIDAVELALVVSGSMVGGSALERLAYTTTTRAGNYLARCQASVGWTASVPAIAPQHCSFLDALDLSPEALDTEWCHLSKRDYELL